jgi:GTP 3',8-cyclase
MAHSALPVLQDRSGRKISYLRLSVTDRCDFRCNYCMPVNARFAAREEVLTLEEHVRLVRSFSALGVRKVRLTGGEPLMRRNVVSLVESIAGLPEQLDVTMTTNGSQLVRHARDLKLAGLSRLNISLDSLRAERFKSITHHGELDQVLRGIDAARNAGFDRIKLNVVAMRGVNDDEIIDLVEYAMRSGLNISFIEEMPFGDSSRLRAQSFMSSDEVRKRIEEKYAMVPTVETTGGPARYYRLPGTETRVGLISPHSHNFCDTCNRVRVTATGDLYTCLGDEGKTGLLPLLRKQPGDEEALRGAIVQALMRKPDGHRFGRDFSYVPLRFMSRTGG